MERDYTINSDGYYVEPPTRRAPSDYSIKGFGHEGTYHVRASVRLQTWTALASDKHAGRA